MDLRTLSNGLLLLNFGLVGGLVLSACVLLTLTMCGFNGLEFTWPR